MKRLHSFIIYLFFLMSFSAFGQLEIKQSAVYDQVEESTMENGRWSRYSEIAADFKVIMLGGDREGQYLIGLSKDGQAYLVINVEYRETNDSKYFYDILSINNQEGYRFSIVASNQKLSTLAKGYDEAEIIVAIEEPNVEKTYSKWIIRK